MKKERKGKGKKAASGKKSYRRIATEEAFSIPEQMDAMRQMAMSAQEYDPDLFLWKIMTDSKGPVCARLLDIDDERLRIMDRDGVAVQVLSLTSTGVQMLDADRGTALATLANDRLAEAIRRHPDRYAGLGTLAPQDPVRAVKEIDRAVSKLKLNGFIINSHTNDEYLSERKYWPMLEAIAAHEVPLYLHPRAPGPAMARAYRADHLEHAIWGYQAETGLHALRLITSSVFDHFPKLKVVLGHMGEAIPYWLYRLDYMHAKSIIGMDRPKLKQDSNRRNAPAESVTIFRTCVSTTASTVGRKPPPFCDHLFLLYLYYLKYLRNQLTSLLLVSVLVHIKRVFCAGRVGRARLRWLSLSVSLFGANRITTRLGDARSRKLTASAVIVGTFQRTTR
jgi:5-carboxyvanillate decarboxylase